VTAIECSTALEAAVRESRLLAAHKPPYNRRSRFPEHEVWVKLTDEPFPRLSVVQKHDPDATCLGQLASRGAAARVVEALQQAFPIRSCTQRLPLAPRGTACLAADLGHCLAPCDGRTSRADYLVLIDQVRNSLHTRFDPVIERLLDDAARHAESGDYERAGAARDALLVLAEAVVASHRNAMLTRCHELVAARPTQAHGWEIHVIRRGRLAAAAVTPPRQDPRPTVEMLRSIADAPVDCAPGSALTELAHLHQWLGGPGVRLVVSEPEGLAMPWTSAHSIARRLRSVRATRSTDTQAGPNLARVSRIAI